MIGCICIVYPQFAARPISSLDFLSRLRWYGPMHAGLVYTETT